MHGDDMFHAKPDASSLDFLSRGRHDAKRVLTDEPEADEYDQEHYRAYGLLRKTNGALFMIDFIGRSGSHCSLPYSHVDRIEYDGAAIVIRFSETIVTVRGYRLAHCHQQLLAHRVLFIAEAGHAAEKLAGGDEPVITGLTIEQVHPGQHQSS